MAVLGGKVYVIGGFDGMQRINSMEAYDPFHNCWSEVRGCIMEHFKHLELFNQKILGLGFIKMILYNYFKCFWSLKTVNIYFSMEMHIL